MKNIEKVEVEKKEEKILMKICEILNCKICGEIFLVPLFLVLLR